MGFESSAFRCSEIVQWLGQQFLTLFIWVRIPVSDPCLVMRLVSQFGCLPNETVSITVRGANLGSKSAMARSLFRKQCVLFGMRVGTSAPRPWKEN